MEARILTLQDKKRALAEAAIEGKKVGKLSMKDILNLFRHDAEDHPNHHDHAGDNEAFNQKVGLLTKSDKGAAGMGVKESERDSYHMGTASIGGVRVKERVLEKGGPGAGFPREESAWSRRW